MSDSGFQLKKAPIVEAVVDIDCDMPPTFDLKALEEPARNVFRDSYPKFQTKFIQQARFQAKTDAPPEMSLHKGIQGFIFLKEDEKQLVQVRDQGFSFNRLAPYSSLDDYLAEIQRTWELFIGLASPVQIRAIRLRYINRILLPASERGVELSEYLKLGPRLPSEGDLGFVSFLNQHEAVETRTGHRVNTVLATQAQEPAGLPLIFDNGVASPEAGSPDDWAWILSTISALRALKNRIFKETLTETCLNLFQH